jgi:hypothetical protein
VIALLAAALLLFPALTAAAEVCAIRTEPARSVALWPPEPDVVAITWQINGTGIGFSYDRLDCSTLYLPAWTRGTLTARAVDVDGDVSGPSAPLVLADPGDVDGDRALTVLDIVIAQRRLAGLDP